MITSYVKTVLLAAVLTVGVAACGDDAPPEEAAARGGGGAAPPKKPKVEKPPPKKIANDDWDKVKPYFLGMKNDPNVRPYAQAPLQTIPDPFQHRLVQFVPRPDPLPEEPEPEEGTDGEDAPLIIKPEEVEAPKGELERYAVRDYSLSLIRWGTTLNKAVLTDPNGQSFIVVKDMKLGNNNGRITDITKYAVIVKEDDRDEPITLSVEPPLLKINAQKTEDNDRLFTSQVAND